MIRLTRYSEPYSATGSLAAVGVLNQLGRPDVEPLEVWVREAIQNCWDAKRSDVTGIRVEIGKVTSTAEIARTLEGAVFVDPPESLPLADVLCGGVEMLYVADFGTHGLGGPTRADMPGEPRDFVDFVRNIGQPADKDFGGGSFGYGKAAHYIASKARTILIDTLCTSTTGGLERRIIGCALGDSYEVDGRPYTGRHWWGQILRGAPEPLTGRAAEALADQLGLPDRSGKKGQGTTVMVLAPTYDLEDDDGKDCSMSFIADALVWNFWPRMIDTPGGIRRSMDFRVIQNGTRVRIPDPRTHPRLRGFVEAMDRIRDEFSTEDDEFTMVQKIESLRPARTLGHLVIQKGPVAPADPPRGPIPQGARTIGAAVHHVALIRAPEIIVKYLTGAAPVTGKLGYSGVFKCVLDVDDAFKAAEPPTHDDWVFRAVQDPKDRSAVKIALERIARQCKKAAGVDTAASVVEHSADIPLGELADTLASLIPSLDGIGARRQPAAAPVSSRRRRPDSDSGKPDDGWTDGGVGAAANGSSAGNGSAAQGGSGDDNRLGGDGGRAAPIGNGPDGSGTAPRPPQMRRSREPSAELTSAGNPVARYYFELRAHGNRVRIAAHAEIMTNDGRQVEDEPPRGYTPPSVLAWTEPSGQEHAGGEVVAGPTGIDGQWSVLVELGDEMMRVDIQPEIA